MQETSLKIRFNVLTFLPVMRQSIALLLQQSQRALSWQCVLPGFDQIFKMLLSPHSSFSTGNQILKVCVLINKFSMLHTHAVIHGAAMHAKLHIYTQKNTHTQSLSNTPDKDDKNLKDQ